MVSFVFHTSTQTRNLVTGDDAPWLRGGWVTLSPVISYQEAPVDETTTNWEPYTKMLQEEADKCDKKVMPSYGLIMMTYMDEEGHVHTRWHIDGRVDMDTLIGTLDRVKFSLHMENMDFVQFTDIEEDDDPDSEPIEEGVDDD